MMKKIFYYLSLLYVALFSSCSNDDTPSQFEETAYLTIAPYKGLYENWIEVTDKPAYIATKEGDNIRKTIESISGFDKIYEKGYEYVIKVRVKPVTDTAGEFWNDAFGCGLWNPGIPCLFHPGEEVSQNGQFYAEILKAVYVWRIVYTDLGNPFAGRPFVKRGLCHHPALFRHALKLV